MRGTGDRGSSTPYVPSGTSTVAASGRCAARRAARARGLWPAIRVPATRFEAGSRSPTASRRARVPPRGARSPSARRRDDRRAVAGVPGTPGQRREPLGDALCALRGDRGTSARRADSLAVVRAPRRRGHRAIAARAQGAGQVAAQQLPAAPDALVVLPGVVDGGLAAPVAGACRRGASWAPAVDVRAGGKGEPRAGASTVGRTSTCSVHRARRPGPAAMPAPAMIHGMCCTPSASESPWSMRPSSPSSSPWSAMTTTRVCASPRIVGADRGQQPADLRSMHAQQGVVDGREVAPIGRP